MRKLATTLLGMGVMVLGGSAYAQNTDTTVSGTTTGTTTATTTTTAPTWTAPATTTTTQTKVVKREEDDGQSDHEKVVGRFAVGYLGLASIPLADTNGGYGAAVSAPVIGVRYWLSPLIGIDAGLGIGWSGGSVETVNGGTTTTTDKASRFGLALHGGVPLSLATAKHFSFQVVPELRVAFASSTIAGAAGTPDTDLSGILFQIGARAGAELHFGFIGVPQLSLQGSVGLYLQHTGVKASQDGATTQSGSNSDTGISTVKFNDPWALFSNTISALYYF